ncbi:MAG: glutamine--fructose-6-phosphate transaminase (isomerizing) [Euryarchaeota archaeon]|nr:glutamine--fructose-6-phosphate transaminase (isomerizing) [Euryarchaeota archaeon]
MCGIIGIVSDAHSGAREILLNGLERLEYRGYDSAGVALVDESTAIYKTAGRVAALRRMVGASADAGTGIAHTRWATHGPPSETNSHPHKDCKGRVVVVHNGIIENFSTLKKALQDDGHQFVSQTDTEVFAHLFEDELAALDKVDLENATAAFRRTISKLDGQYAIVTSVAGLPGVLFAARSHAPLLAGLADGMTLFASDATAVVEHTKQVVYLEDGDLAVATPEGLHLFDIDGKTIERAPQTISWDIEDAQKGGYDHFMLKEIYDGPRAINDALAGRLFPTPPHVRLELGMDDARLRGIGRILILACGTSFHAGMVGKYVIEKLVGIPVEVAYSSEYRYGSEVREEPGLAVAISQSGETADTLAALREARSRGHTVLSVCNVVGSTIARESDGVLYIQSGPEIGVAATKSFLGQLCALYLLAFRLAEIQGTLPASDLRELERGLQHTSRLVDQVLQKSETIAEQAALIAKADSCFFLGRQVLYPIALEGALKLKEISYIHAEGYSGGELKHGPFALLTPDTPVVALLAPDGVYSKMASNIIEVKARGPQVFIVTTASDTEAEQLGDHVIRVPDTEAIFTPLTHAAALHLLSYHAAAARGCEIDKPRNLAKSVTVE